MANQNPPEIVQFADGRFGIRRKKSYGDEYEFCDMRAGKNYWWGTDQSYFANDCRATKREVQDRYAFLHDLGTPVSLTEPLEPCKEEVKMNRKFKWSERLIRLLW
jgi:hypothetical protein